MAVKIKVMILLLVSSAALLFLFMLSDQLQVYNQKPCSCDKCLSEDKTFLFHHASHSVEPFLTANSKLSEEDYMWWKHLQGERQNFNVFKATVKDLFQIFPAKPHLEKPSSDQCRTCAVVGNSVNLRRSHYGPLIDSQDVVIRINHGKVKGYEKDVGSRTTHRVMYPESATQIDSTTHLVLFPFKMQDLQWLLKVYSKGYFGSGHPSNASLSPSQTLSCHSRMSPPEYVYD
ncbi:CMP-N-acetylneuraminate-beta-galactosamide-alpha-2,3-sialyltransferase 1-like [Nematolebias whitei]|uniref:CMP-N-acetylneuraminate-beta-galactosamide- alpha-2,3-sialyltransferase 1-like n=1 Tax=Nematolebias whitei TaxID=451745 RepID=UPI001899B738|nr:CMP-N-acetylneuraminate-beta-galactosamide-alpha-2,3-sialyltransferase 1-like [Nematolebias whitei]